MDKNAKGGLTEFWELLTVNLARPKISNVNDVIFDDLWMSN